MFNNKKQLVCTSNLSLEIKKKLMKSCVCSVAVGKNEEKVTNAFETWWWRKMLHINGQTG